MNTKPIDLTGQTILALIPSLITQLIAFFRIQKFKKGVLISLGAVGASIGVQMLLPFPYGIIMAFPIVMTIPTYFVRKWTRQFNDNLSYTPQETPSPIQDNFSEINNEQNTKSLKILKERLARGDVSKEEYDELKKEFE